MLYLHRDFIGIRGFFNAMKQSTASAFYKDGQKRLLSTIFSLKNIPLQKVALEHRLIRLTFCLALLPDHALFAYSLRSVSAFLFYER